MLFLLFCKKFDLSVINQDMVFFFNCVKNTLWNGDSFGYGKDHCFVFSDLVRCADLADSEFRSLHVNEQLRFDSRVFCGGMEMIKHLFGG